MSNQQQYKAFISYSREDEKYVKKLHIKLEDYKIPKELYKKYPNLPKKLSPIFRDIEQLKSGDKLPKEILKKLIDSENLIVVCSPRSAKSEWVDKEIIDFKKMYGEDRIFPIIIDGIPHTNDENECFPEALKYKVDDKGELTDTKTDILASNIIKSADGKRFAEVKLISGLLGVENDDLWNFEEKRRNQRLIHISIAVTIFILFLIGVALYSIEQKNKAEKARGEAENLIDYMLFDLRNKLESTVTSSTLNDIQHKVNDYYIRMGTNDNNHEVLHRKTAYYENQGDIYLTQGKLSLAKIAYENGLNLKLFLVKSTPNVLSEKRGLAVAYEKIAHTYDLEGNLSKAKTFYINSLNIKKKLHKLNPRNLMWKRDLLIAHDNIARVYSMEGNLSKAKIIYTNTLNIRKTLSQSDLKNSLWQRDLSISYENLGYIYKEEGNLTKANWAYEKTLNIRKKLNNLNPKNIQWVSDLSIGYNNLGHLYKDRNNFTKAEFFYFKALNIIKKIVVFDVKNKKLQRSLSINYENLGFIYNEDNNLSEAKEAYTKALKIRKELSNFSPNNMIWKRDLAVSLDNLGNIYKKEDNLLIAKKNYKNALKIKKELILYSSKNTLWQRDLSVSHEKIGSIYDKEKKLSQAIVEYKKSLKIRKNLIKIDSKNSLWQRDLAVIYDRIASLYRRNSKIEKAKIAYKNALKIKKKLLELDNNNIIWQRDLAVSYYNFFRIEENISDKITNLSNSIELLENMKRRGRLSQDDKKILKEMKSILDVYNITIYNLTIKKINNKIKKTSYDYNLLANIYYATKQYKYAIINYKKVLNLNPKNGLAFINLYELKFIINQDVDRDLEKNYIKNFKKNKKSFMIYEMLKILKKITNDKMVNIDIWEKKYTNTLFHFGFNQLNEWSKTIKDKKIKDKIDKALTVFKKYSK